MTVLATGDRVDCQVLRVRERAYGIQRHIDDPGQERRHPGSGLLDLAATRCIPSAADHEWIKGVMS
jgi:hypothetical protein